MVHKALFCDTMACLHGRHGPLGLQEKEAVPVGIGSSGPLHAHPLLHGAGGAGVLGGCWLRLVPCIQKLLGVQGCHDGQQDVQQERGVLFDWVLQRYRSIQMTSAIPSTPGAHSRQG